MIDLLLIFADIVLGVFLGNRMYIFLGEPYFKELETMRNETPDG